MGNYIDKDGNYQNVENLTLRQIYDRGIEKGKNERPTGKWIESHEVSCGKILQMRSNVIEHKCNSCNRWAIRWAGTISDNFCPSCGERMI